MCCLRMRIRVTVIIERNKTFLCSWKILKMTTMLRSSSMRMKLLSNSLLLDFAKLFVVHLIDYHCLLKVKAEMDQFLDGLCLFGILDVSKPEPVCGANWHSAGMIISALIDTCIIVTLCLQMT